MQFIKINPRPSGVGGGGAEGASALPKCLVWWKSGQTPWKFGQNPRKSGQSLWKLSQNPWKSEQTPWKHRKKWRPMCFDL